MEWVSEWEHTAKHTHTHRIELSDKRWQAKMECFILRERKNQRKSDYISRSLSAQHWQHNRHTDTSVDLHWSRVELSRVELSEQIQSVWIWTAGRVIHLPKNWHPLYCTVWWWPWWFDPIESNRHSTIFGYLKVRTSIKSRPKDVQVHVCVWGVVKQNKITVNSPIGTVEGDDAINETESSIANRWTDWQVKYI